MCRGDVRLRRVVGITAVVGVVSGGTLWVVVVISVPYPFIILNMMRIPATLCSRLGKQHIGAPRGLEDLVLVGFSKRSCSPDIGVRESAVVPGRNLKRPGGPARRRKIFGTHINRGILAGAVVSGRIYWSPRRRCAGLRIAAGPAVSCTRCRASRRCLEPAWPR